MVFPTYQRYVAEVCFRNQSVMGSLLQIIASCLTVMDQLCLRRIGLQLPDGRILSHGSPGLRVRCPVTAEYICRREQCDCGLEEDHYMEKRSPTLDVIKQFAIRRLPIEYARATYDQNGVQRWNRTERYIDRYEHLPTITFYFQPTFKRGENYPFTLTDDFVVKEKDLSKNNLTQKNVSLIDAETNEVVVREIRCLGSAGHNPVGKVKCENVMRMFFEFRERSLDDPQLLEDHHHLQCRECATAPQNIWEKKRYSPASRFERMHIERDIYGIDRVTVGIEGPRFISFA